MEVNVDYFLNRIIIFFTKRTSIGLTLCLVVRELGQFITKLLVISKKTKSKSKTYDYTQYDCDYDYVFEVAEKENYGYMTSQKPGIKKGDYLILSNGSNKIEYQVEEIEYYSNPSDMWIALLKQVSIEK